MLQLLIIRNYRRTNFLHIKLFIYYIFFILDPTTQDGKIRDPIRPNPTRLMDGPDLRPTLERSQGLVIERSKCVQSSW